LLHQDASRAAAESTAGVVNCLHNRFTFIFPTSVCATISATGGNQPRTSKYKDSDISTSIPSSFEKTEWQCKSNYSPTTAIPVTWRIIPFFLKYSSGAGHTKHNPRITNGINKRSLTALSTVQEGPTRSARIVYWATDTTTASDVFLPEKSNREFAFRCLD
jgi:hypothetical protein